MKVLRCLSFAIVLSILASGPTSAIERKIGLVLEEEVDRHHDLQVMNIASQAFVDSQSFQLIERAQLEKIVQEQDLQSFTGENIQILGELAGLDYLGLVNYSVEVTRTDTGRSYDYAVSARIIDVDTGAVMTTIRSEDPGWKDIVRNPFGKSGAASAAALLTQDIREEFPVEGYVIKVSGGDVIVDLGESAGVQKGDVLSVIRQGESILHPVTGEELPGEEREIARLKVTSASDETAICKLKGKGSMPKLGERVRFKQ